MYAYIIVSMLLYVIHNAYLDILLIIVTDLNAPHVLTISPSAAGGGNGNGNGAALYAISLIPTSLSSTSGVIRTSHSSTPSADRLVNTVIYGIDRDQHEPFLDFYSSTCLSVCIDMSIIYSDIAGNQASSTIIQSIVYCKSSLLVYKAFVHVYV